MVRKALFFMFVIPMIAVTVSVWRVVDKKSYQGFVDLLAIGEEYNKICKKQNDGAKKAYKTCHGKN